MGTGWLSSIIVAIALLAPLVHGADAPADCRRGWQELSLLNAGEARQAFAAAHPANREARLGEALSLLQSRSRTPETIAAAAHLLESLCRERADDDSGIAAAYYLARVEQVHRFAPNRPAALAGYRALLAAHPGHHYAQLASPKLALLLLYDDVPPAEWEHRVGEVQALISQLTEPEARRDTQLVLATALIRLRHDHARAYPLIASCLAAGSVTRMTRLNALLVQAAESAERLGRPAEAAGYYQHFLAEFPRDSKSDEIRRRLGLLKVEAGS
jgi:hypothetical protein